MRYNVAQRIGIGILCNICTYFNFKHPCSDSYMTSCQQDGRPAASSVKKVRLGRKEVAIFPTDCSCNFPTDEIMNAENFSTALKSFQNGGFCPKFFVFLEKHF